MRLFVVREYDIDGGSALIGVYTDKDRAYRVAAVNPGAEVKEVVADQTLTGHDGTVSEAWPGAQDSA